MISTPFVGSCFRIIRNAITQNKGFRYTGFETEQTTIAEIIKSGDNVCTLGHDHSLNYTMYCSSDFTNWTKTELTGDDIGTNATFANGKGKATTQDNTLYAVIDSDIEGETSALYSLEDGNWERIDSTIRTGTTKWVTIGSYFSNIIMMVEHKSNGQAQVYLYNTTAQTLTPFSAVNFDQSGQVDEVFLLNVQSGMPMVALARDNVAEIYIYSPFDDEWSRYTSAEDFPINGTPAQVIHAIEMTDEGTYISTSLKDENSIVNPRVWGPTESSDDGGDDNSTTTTTLPENTGTQPDDDGDGISNAVEDAGPNDGDANGDGIPDSQQGHVTSFVNPITGKYVTIATREGLTITNANVKEKGTQSDRDYDYPFGLVNYSVTGLDVGETIEVQIYFETTEDAKNFVPRKFINNTYIGLQGSALENVEVGDSKAIKLTLGITDGGELDADGIANGVIEDPVGLAVQAGSLATTGTNLGNSIATVVILLGVGLSIMWVVKRRKESILA